MNDKIEYNKDLKLYIDMCKTLSDYRLSLFPIISIQEFRKLKNRDKDLMKRLAKRLNIKTLDLEK